MFVCIQSYNIAVNMHASPVVPDCVRHCKNESKSDIAVSLFYKKIERFRRSIVRLSFQELRRIKTKLFVNQNVSNLLKKYDGCKAWEILDSQKISYVETVARPYPDHHKYMHISTLLNVLKIIINCMIVRLKFLLFSYTNRQTNKQKQK